MVHHNVSVYLPQSILKCVAHGIYNFRVSANIFTCNTHHIYGYRYELLPANTRAWIRYCGDLARSNNIRLTFHHNHFIVPGSDNDDIAARSIYEIEWISRFCIDAGIDTQILHCAGKGDKLETLERLAKRLEQLPREIVNLLAFENDHSRFTPTDTNWLAQRVGVRTVYDVHHHRLNPDGVDVATATQYTIDSNTRAGLSHLEPLFHISSPQNGWNGKNQHAHADYIDIGDFPREWLQYIDDPYRHITVEIETKRRELAVAQLYADLQKLHPPTSR
jgi:UV DNA damage endonuclease